MLHKSICPCRTVTDRDFPALDGNSQHRSIRNNPYASQVTFVHFYEIANDRLYAVNEPLTGFKIVVKIGRFQSF